MSTPFGQLPKVETDYKGDRLEFNDVIGLTLIAGSLFWPRLFILGFWIFGSQLGDAFSSWVIPAIGFFVAPWTTAAYALMWGAGGDSVSGFWEWLVVAGAILLDVLTYWGIGRLRHLRP